MNKPAFCGDDIIDLCLPGRTRTLYASEPKAGLVDFEGEVRNSIRNPLGTEPLRSLVNQRSRVTIAFDDPCLPLPPMRNDPRGRAIGVILEELLSAGLSSSRITLLCANGLHRKWTHRELRFILGKNVFSQMGPERIVNHDAEDPQGIVDVGTSSSGCPVRVNSRVTGSDLLIYVNVNWTSMNGGWKSVLVGLGDYQSIRSHHNVSVLAEGGTVMDEESEFHRIMREMGEVVQATSNVFTVETVLNNRVWGGFLGKLLGLQREKPPLALKSMAPLPHGLKRTVSSFLRSAYQPIAVNAGSVGEVHPVTLDALRAEQEIEVEGQSDALLVGIPNISPYAVFSTINPILVANTALGYLFNMYRGKPLVRKGGAMIILQPFLPGFHPVHHPSYIEFFEKVLPQTRDPLEMEESFEEDFARRPEYIRGYRSGNAYHGVHPFYVWYWGAGALEHLSRIIVVGAVDRGIVERFGFENAGSLDAALSTVAEHLGEGFSMSHMVVPPVFSAAVS